MKLLLVEDNPRLGPMVARGLREDGHVVELVDNGADALAAAGVSKFDAIVLDLMLPDVDGLTVLARLRREGNATPVLVLTARDSLDDRVQGLDRGADDYLVKPFELDELLARLRALVRRATAASTTSVITVADLEVDTRAKLARRGGQEIVLSAREFAVLHALLANAGRVMTRTQLEGSIYGWRDEPDSNALEVHIHHLRKKLGPDFIKTLRGVGYTIPK
jgi:DNA-binding response OmpR family regulator